MPKVAKPFNSTVRRFAIGADVNEADDLSPHTFADLKLRGFIADESAAVEAAKPSFFKRGALAIDS